MQVTPNKPSPEIRDRLSRPLIPQATRAELTRLVVGPSAGDLFSLLTVGDFLYDLARIDPVVLEAADFASAAELGNRFSFADYAVGHEAMSDAAAAGDLSRLKGYVAERVVASNLSAAGHDVSFPARANNEGWDLLVDGTGFQVKCVESAESVRAHLATYPDIPVIVNAELADLLGGEPGVYVDPALSVDAITDQTAEALENGAELLDFDIPFTAFLATSVSQAVLLSKGLVDLEFLPVAIAAETTGRITGGAIGKFVGSGLGFVLFGPAGGVVGSLAGTIGGATGVTRVVRRIERRFTGRQSEVYSHARDLARALCEVVPRKAEAWEAKIASVEATAADPGESAEIKAYVIERGRSDIGYFRRTLNRIEKLARGIGIFDDAFPYANRVLTEYRRAAVHPHEVQGELKRLLSSVGQSPSGSDGR